MSWIESNFASLLQTRRAKAPSEDAQWQLGAVVRQVRYVWKIGVSDREAINTVSAKPTVDAALDKPQAKILRKSACPFAAGAGLGVACGA